jgi:hypothetical protein
VVNRGVCVALLICGWSLDAAAAISVMPSPLDAGTALIGQPTTSSPGTVTSSTNVHADLVITNNCSTTGGGTFTLSDTSNLNLNPSAPISVTYTPSAPGIRTCRVDAYDTGTMTLLGSFTVRGEGQAPATMVTSGTPDFGATRWNNAAPVHTTTRTFTVSNTGSRQLDVTLSITGTNAGDFAITTGGTTASIAGGGAKTWTITFDPVAAGDNRSATLTISGRDAVDGASTINPEDQYTLLGDGTNAIISVGAPIAFGIVNAGSSLPGDVSVANIGGATRGALGITTASIADPNNSGWFSFTGSCSGQSCTFSPALSILNMTTVTVRCSPPVSATANQMQSATITFGSDTDNAASTPDNSTTLTCTAGKSDLSTNQNVLTFSPQLVASTTTPNMITITNNGNVSTTYYLVKSGTNQGSFALSTPGSCGLTPTVATQCPIGPMSSSTFSVTFTPGLEGDVTAGVTIIPAASTPVQVTLTGRGIDRHIQLAETMIQAADTFRNPGDKATVIPVSIRNSGEYPLNISSIQLDGAPNWQPAEPFTPFVIGGLATVEVNVLFTPVIAGKAPDGTLAIVSDDPDPARRLLNVIVSGNGKDRNVAMPGPIDFGNTGAGVPVKLSQIKLPADWLTVQNMDDTMFTIREMTFDMPDVFKVQTLSGDDINNLDLPVGAIDQFEIVFLPPKVGDYTANISLFLDQDPESQRTIQVHGNALFVDAHGGGGCSAGHGAGGGMLLALGLLLRRKRRRA